MEITFDTDFDPDYPVYTRANAGEVLPDVIGPLGWSLAGPCFEEGFRIALCDNLAALPRPQGRQFQLTGRFAGYFHLNLSALRTAAERLPGTSADAVDRQYLGDAAAHGLPAHGPSSSELWWKARAGVASARTSVTLTHQVAAQRKGLVRLRAQNRELVANGASAGQLLGALRMLSASHSATFGAHVTARALTSSALELATNAMRRCGLGAEEALRRIADIPGLESSKPSRGLVELAHRVANQAEPAGLLASGVCIADLRNSSAPGASSLCRDVDSFIETFGHRGVNEYDPTVAVWEQKPDDVLHLLAGLASHRGEVPGSPAPPSRVVAPDRAGKNSASGRVAAVLVTNARKAMLRGELSKDNVIRVTNEMRRLIWALGPLVADRLSPTEMNLVTIDELAQVVGGRSIDGEELARRRAELDQARKVQVAEWSQSKLSLTDRPRSDSARHDNAESDGAQPDGARQDDAVTLIGIPGSAGRAIGRARVMVDPYAHFEEGDILVAEITDTAWTPLFAIAGAVVTDVGGILSHATIVARDLGIPAVVNTKTGTWAINDGDTVEVDGTSGTVNVLARNGPAPTPCG